MASKLNSEFNYRYLVQGETPWAKLKTLQGFLEGRIRAAALEAVSDKKHQAKIAELEHARNISALPHVVLLLEAELLEMVSFFPAQTEAFELNREEIAMLNRLIAEMREITEPTRITGYTDEQMFEANAENEFTLTVAKEIQAEIIATGRPSPAKLHNAMSNPHSFAALQAMGLIPADVKQIVFSLDPPVLLIPTVKE